MTKRVWALMASLSVSACSASPAWLFATTPHDRAGWALAAGAAASDAPASDVPAVAIQVRLDGEDVPVAPVVQTRFDSVGTAAARAYRAVYDLGDPDDPEACRVTLTLVASKPFDQEDFTAADLLQTAYQVRRSAKGNQVSRQAVLMGDQLLPEAFSVTGDRVAVRLEQHAVFAAFDLSTVIAVDGLPRR